MNRRGLAKIYLGVIVAILVVAVSAAYFALTIQHGGGLHRTGLQEELRIVDIVGRNVTLPKNVSRIIAIGPGMLRLVCYLNATDMLVGVEESETRWGFTGRDYAMAYGELFRRLPVIGPGGPGRPPAPELILAVKPDLIIMHRGYCEFYDPDRLQRETNATVIVMDYGPAGQLDIEGFAWAMKVLGKALNREERAKQLIKFVESIRDDLNKRTTNITSRPKVYVGAISYRGPQPFTTTQTPFPPLTLLNTRSIADKYSNTTGVFFWDFETIIVEQPEIIFIDENNLATVKSDFDKDPRKYRQLNAFREGKVYGMLPYNYYHTNIAVALADAYWIGKVLYPDKFKDVDPVAKADEIFIFFLGKPLYEEYAKAYGGFINLAWMFKVP